MKRRLRQGAKLIVADPRRIDLVRTPHIEADYHLKLRPGTNVALINTRARHRHRGTGQRRFRARALRARTHSRSGATSWRRRRTPRRRWRASPACPRPRCAPRRACMPRAAMARSTTASASPSTARARPWSWASPTSRWPPATSAAKASASIRCAARTTCRARATWARSRTSSRVSPRVGRRRAARVRARLGCHAARRAGPAHPQHVRGGARRRIQGPVHRGRGHRPVRSEHAARDRRADRDGMHHRAGPVPERDRQVRPRVPARLVVPGKGRHLHQRRAAHLARAPGDAAEVRLRGLGNHAAAVERAGLSDELYASVGDHGRDRAADADLHRCQLRAHRSSSAAFSGPATTSTRTARRPCTSASSCAARATSC